MLCRLKDSSPDNLQLIVRNKFKTQQKRGGVGESGFLAILKLFFEGVVNADLWPSQFTQTLCSSRLISRPHLQARHFFHWESCRQAPTGAKRGQTLFWKVENVSNKTIIYISKKVGKIPKLALPFQLSSRTRLSCRQRWSRLFFSEPAQRKTIENLEISFWKLHNFHILVWKNSWRDETKWKPNESDWGVCANGSCPSGAWETGFLSCFNNIYNFYSNWRVFSWKTTSPAVVRSFWMEILGKKRFGARWSCNSKRRAPNFKIRL